MATPSPVRIGTVGDSLVKEQPQSYGYSVTRGDWIRRTFKGPKTDIYALSQDFKASQWDVDVQELEENAILSAMTGTLDDGAVEVPIPVWEKQVARIQKEIYEHPSFLALGQTVVKGLREYFQSPTESSPAVAATNASSMMAYRLLLAGVTSYVVEQPIVILTEIVSSNYARSGSKNYVGQVLTFGQMSTLENAPESVLDNVADYAAAGSATAEAIGYTLKYGYKKLSPILTQQAGNKWHMVSQWEAGQWCPFLDTFV